jgi:hypothetical protein
MATSLKKAIKSVSQFGGTPYGNKAVLSFNVATNASGVWLNGSLATAAGTSDEIVPGILPAGMKLLDCLAIVSDAFAATQTVKVGFRYVDGVDSTAVPQDADYFFAALALSAQGRTRANNLTVAPVTLPKDAYLVLDVDGAAMSTVGVLDILVEGVIAGAP